MSEPPSDHPLDFSAIFNWQQTAPDKLDYTPQVSLTLNAGEMKRVYSLVDRLRADSPVRQIAEQFLKRGAERLSTLGVPVEPLVRPNRCGWRERQTAAWLLGRALLDKEQRDFAANTLTQAVECKLELTGFERVKKALLWSLIPGILLAALSNMEWTFITLYPWVFLGALVYERGTAVSIRAEAARALGQLAHPESLETLIGALQQDRRVRQAAVEALPNVLASLTPDYYGQIRADTMQGLCRLLTNEDETLAVAILQAFVHVGDGSALPIVEKLAAGGGRAGRETRVQQAAQICLPVLQARLARERDPQVLLRASFVPQMPSDQLLRPASEADAVDPMEMLRASVDPAWRGTEEDIGLVVQIIEDLRRQGGTRALPCLETIVHADKVDGRIRRAAYDALPTLHAHAELDRISPPDPVNETNTLGFRSDN